MTSLVFIPVSRADALALRAGANLGERQACAPTASLAGTLGPQADVEEVEFAALSHAGVLALSAGADPLRMVLAADVSDQQVTDLGSELGQVVLTGLRWDQVQALFADEPAAEPAVAKARADVAEIGADGAVTAEAVAVLQSEFDLLWFAPEELDQLISDQR